MVAASSPTVHATKSLVNCVVRGSAQESTPMQAKVTSGDRQSYDFNDFDADAEWAIKEGGASGARKLIWIAVLAVVVLVVWAAYGDIDEVVRGEGKVVPSRQVQIIQSLDGGIVEEILVREGEPVEPGQVLLRVDPTRY